MFFNVLIIIFIILFFILITLLDKCYSENRTLKSCLKEKNNDYKELYRAYRDILDIYKEKYNKWLEELERHKQERLNLMRRITKIKQNIRRKKKKNKIKLIIKF